MISDQDRPLKIPFNLPLKEVLIFCLPLIAGQLGQMMFGIGDILVAGRYSNTVVSAMGIGVGIFAPFLMVGLGITFAVSPLTAKLKGEGKPDGGILFNALVVSTMIGLILFFGLIAMTYFLNFFELVESIEGPVKVYLRWTAISIFPLLYFQAYKEYLQGHGATYFSNGTILFFNITNIGINVILMFGLGPFPELGIKGAAISTVLNRFGMAIVLGVFTHKRFKTTLKVNKDEIKEIISLGLPIGVGTLTEILVFSTVTVLIGKMTVLASASHNIVLNLASFTFMVPLAISSAASVFVAEKLGKKDLAGLTRYSLASLTLSVLFMCCTAVLYFFIPEYLLRLATDNEEVIKYGSGLLVFVAFFQIPDGIQVTFWGILRGFGVTKTPMALSLIANWAIGLPFGIYLVKYHSMEAAGLWAGLALGLYLMSIGLAGVFLYNRRKLAKQFSH